MYQLGVTKNEVRHSPFPMDSLVEDLCSSDADGPEDPIGVFTEYFKHLRSSDTNHSFESMGWPLDKSLENFLEQIKLTRFWSNDVSPWSPISTCSTD